MTGSTESALEDAALGGTDGSEPRRRIALVSFFFPPDGGAGTQRTAKFARYLPASGWNPTVVTRRIPDTRGRWDPHDPTVTPDLDVPVIRVPVEGVPSAWAQQCRDWDMPLPWLDAVYEALRERHDQFDAVMFSMSPFCLTLVGQRLQEEFGTRVLYDLRDPWALDGWRLYRSRGQWRRDYERMEKAIRSADGVIANTPDARQAILDAFSGLDGDRIEVVTNGFDDEALPASEPVDRDEGAFTIVHTGTLHSDNLYAGRGLRGLVRRFRRYRCEPLATSGRTARHLLEAIKLMRDAGDPLAERVRVVLVGVKDAATERCVAESGVSDRVTVTGYVPHAESVRWLQRADALFLPLGGMPQGHRSRIVPGKAYEYIASGRPILACLPPGDALDLVREHTLCVAADPLDPHQIRDAIAALDDEDRTGPFVSTAFVERYHRRALAARLASFCERVVATR